MRNDGRFLHQAEDWERSVYPVSPTDVSELSVLSTNGLTAIHGGSEGRFSQAQASPIIGLSGTAYLDNGAWTNNGWGVYGECRMITATGATGNCIGAEFDVTNLSGQSYPGVSPFTAYVPHYAGDLQLACGGEAVSAGPCSWGVNIANNGARFVAGLIFGADALVGNDGRTGSAPAIEMPRGDTITWFDYMGGGSNFITSHAQSHAIGGVIDLYDGGVDIENGDGAVGVQLAAMAKVMNYPILSGSSVGRPVSVGAGGRDADVSIVLSPKGNAPVILDAHQEFHGPPPSASAGVGASLEGDDNVGRITVGASAGQVIRLTFARPWTNPPRCAADDETSAVFLRPTSVTTTGLSFAATAPMAAGDKVSYDCRGYQ